METPLKPVAVKAREKRATRVQFDPLKRNGKRWPLVLYAALTLTLLRNLSLNILGAAFVARLSDHFYLEDAEMMEMHTDQMQFLSIIAVPQHQRTVTMLQ